MKKCKACDGKGFVFDTMELPSNKTLFGFPITQTTGVKFPCNKCFGKGTK